MQVVKASNGTAGPTMYKLGHNIVPIVLHKTLSMWHNWCCYDQICVIREQVVDIMIENKENEQVAMEFYRNIQNCPKRFTVYTLKNLK